MARWTVVTRYGGSPGVHEVVEAGSLDVLAGALVFLREDGGLVVGYGPGAWTKVVEGGPGELDGLPDGAQVYGRAGR